MNLFKKALSLFLTVLVLLGTVPLISLPAHAADNASTGGYSDGNYNGGWYDARNSMPGAFWKASVYVRLNDNNTTNNTTRLDNPMQWQKLGKSVYIHWNETYFKSLLKGNVLFTQNNKVDYLEDSSTPGDCSIFDETTNYTKNPTYLIDTKAKPVPGLYDGNPKAQLDAVKSYFGNTDTLKNIITKATNKNSVMGAIGNISFTLDGVTMKGSSWEGKTDYNGKEITLLPSGTNAVAYTIVYEPVVVAHLRTDTSYNTGCNLGSGNNESFKAVAFTATEFAIAQAKDLINMNNSGTKPQVMNRFFRQTLPSAAKLAFKWFGYGTYGAFDTNTSNDNIYKHGGWGMRYLRPYNYVFRDYSIEIVSPKSGK